MINRIKYPLKYKIEAVKLGLFFNEFKFVVEKLSMH